MTSSNLLHIGRVREVEIRLILGISIITLLNVVIYKSLSTTEPAMVIFLNGIGLHIYALCIFLMVVFTFLRKEKFLGYTFYTLLSLLAINIVVNLFDLIANKRISDNGQAILLDAFLIWISSLVVFGFWYWILDRGGPIARAEERGTRPDLLFPQHQTKIPGWENFKPDFWDYFVFSFFTSTGFSPADTLPLTQRAKILMVIEASISLVIIGMVVSRAISLIQ